MSEAAVKRMTLAQFLRWEDGTDARYELVAGVPAAMAPPAIAHGILGARLCAEIDATLRSRRSCMAQVGASIARPDRNDTCYIADLAVTRTRPERGQQLIEDPLLIVEILSPGTALYDRQTKVSDYRRIPSVEEILLIDPTSIFAEVLRREGDRWITEIVRGPQAVLSLASIGLTAAISDLYEGIDLPDAATRADAGGREGGVDLTRGALLPRPACGERVGVRGNPHRTHGSGVAARSAAIAAAATAQVPRTRVARRRQPFAISRSAC